MRVVVAVVFGFVAALVGVLGVVAPAGATWSIVGVDPATGQMGVAVASCVPLDVLDTSGGFDLIALVPGEGAGISQADYLPAAREEIERQLVAGAAAADVIAAVTDRGFDSSVARRQHAVVTVDGVAAAHTGGGNFAVAADRQAANVSVQGNILVSEAVVDDALAAFAREGDRTLADRLVDSLEAGSLAGGDARCDEQTALFAHVSVIDSDGSRSAPNVLDLTTSAQRRDGRNPVAELAAQYRALPDDGSDAGSGSVVLVAAVVGGVVVFIAAAIAMPRRKPRPW